MKLIKPMDSEKIEEFTCQVCDQAFIHPNKEKLACPKCGATGEKWLLRLPVQDVEGGQPREIGTDSNMAVDSVQDL